MFECLKWANIWNGMICNMIELLKLLECLEWLNHWSVCYIWNEWLFDIFACVKWLLASACRRRGWTGLSNQRATWYCLWLPCRWIRHSINVTHVVAKVSSCPCSKLNARWEARGWQTSRKRAQWVQTREQRWRGSCRAQRVSIHPWREIYIVNSEEVLSTTLLLKE